MARIGENVGPYTLITKLGSGGFGVVWLAERRTAITTTKVALKCPLGDEIDLAVIKHEADLWARASGHPNVVPIIEADIYDGQVVIVSEYAPGGTLAAKLAELRGTRMPVGAAVEMISGILAGLEHLHSKNIIHRDLKPANILIQGNIPRLADFGISRVLKTTSQSSNVAGTPVYMAPEAFNGERSVQTDIWSVGVIFYEMLAGQLPYPPTDYTSLVAAILTRDPAPLPGPIPALIQQITNRALSKDRMKRFKSAAEMRYALRSASQVLETQTGTATQPIEMVTTKIEPPAPPTAKRQDVKQGIAPHYVYAMTAIVIALLFLGGFFLFFKLRSESVAPAALVASDKPSAAVTANSTQIGSGIVEKPATSPNLPATKNGTQSLTPFQTVEFLILNDKLLSFSDIATLSQEELRLLRNTVYARHGKPFQTQEMQRHFTSRPWYTIHTNYDNTELTANDQANIKIIQSAEK